MICYIILSYIILYSIILYYLLLSYIIIYYYIILYYIKLYYIILLESTRYKKKENGDEISKHQITGKFRGWIKIP